MVEFNDSSAVQLAGKSSPFSHFAEAELCSWGCERLSGSQWQDSSNGLLGFHLPLCLCWEKEDESEAKWERVFVESVKFHFRKEY